MLVWSHAVKSLRAFFLYFRVGMESA